MAVYGRLSAVDAKLPGVAYAIYTIPTTEVTTYATLDLNVCNRGNEASVINIYILTSTGVEIPIELDFPVGPKDTFLRTSIMVSTGDTVYARSNYANISYVAYGMQDGANTLASLPLPSLPVDGETAPPVILQNAQFGSSTFANSTTYMISGEGSVYVYSAVDDSLTDTLTEPTVGEGFGDSIAANTFFWAVGAPTANVDGNTEAGAVYIYNSFTGSLITKLECPNASANAKFGSSIDMNDDYLVISAPGAGIVYVFDPADTATPLQTFSEVSSTTYGTSVGIDGSFVVIGDPGLGVVETYSASSGVQGTTLISPVIETDFGFDVDVRNGLIVVGAPKLDANGVTDNGGAYLYDTLGTLIASLESPLDATNSDYLGWSVAIASNFVLVGSPFIDANGEVDAGSVYAYDYNGEFVAIYNI